MSRKILKSFRHASKLFGCAFAFFCGSEISGGCGRPKRGAWRTVSGQFWLKWSMSRRPRPAFRQRTEPSGRSTISFLHGTCSARGIGGYRWSPILKPLESRLRQLRPAKVPEVQTRSAKVIALATSLLRWPGRDQAQLPRGLPLLGVMPEPGISAPCHTPAPNVAVISIEYVQDRGSSRHGLRGRLLQSNASRMRKLQRRQSLLRLKCQIPVMSMAVIGGEGRRCV